MNVHLERLHGEYGAWLYSILFLIVFVETGLVLMPFLPGDSLLFAAGALAGSGALDITTVMVLLVLAALIGDSTNYWLGRLVGPRIARLINPKHLERTRAYFETYGGKTIIIARFIPIVRTMCPFVAGIGRMPYGLFVAYGIAGAVLWVSVCCLAGYFFGQWEIVKKNFSLVILAIIFISVLPAFVEIIRARRSAGSPLPSQTAESADKSG